MGATAKLVYIDMDDTICAFTDAFNASLKINPAIAYPQSQYRFFANLQPIPGAIDALIALSNSVSYTPYILTSPSIPNPLSYVEKREWVEKHLGYDFCKQLILCPNKGLLKGDILIDDNCAGKGQDLFEGEIIHYGSEQYPDWMAVRMKLNV